MHGIRHLAFTLAIFAALCLTGANAVAAEYKIDPSHSFVQFRIQHLGYSWLYGRFNKIEGEFSHDPSNPGANRINVEIDTASIDSNHAERDKHLREEDFLDVKKYPTAIFASSRYEGDTGQGKLHGELTLHGVSRPISIDVKKLGEGTDPWGGYRAGFIGTTNLRLSDFGITYDLGPASETMELELGIEGIRK